MNDTETSASLKHHLMFVLNCGTRICFSCLLSKSVNHIKMSYEKQIVQIEFTRVHKHTSMYQHSTTDIWNFVGNPNVQWRNCELTHFPRNENLIEFNFIGINLNYSTNTHIYYTTTIRFKYTNSVTIHMCDDRIFMQLR